MTKGKSLKERVVLLLGIIAICVAFMTCLYYSATITNGAYQSEQDNIRCYHSEYLYGKDAI